MKRQKINNPTLAQEVKEPIKCLILCANNRGGICQAVTCIRYKEAEDVRKL